MSDEPERPLRLTANFTPLCRGEALYGEGWSAPLDCYEGLFIMGPHANNFDRFFIF
jgi:hypothetical protein